MRARCFARASAESEPGRSFGRLRSGRELPSRSEVVGLPAGIVGPLGEQIAGLPAALVVVIVPRRKTKTRAKAVQRLIGTRASWPAKGWSSYECIVSRTPGATQKARQLHVSIIRLIAESIL